MRLTATSTRTDGDNDTVTNSNFIDLGGNIRFSDDGPIAGNSSKIATVDPVITNLTLVLDVSGSMSTASGIPGLTRLQAEKQAAIDLIEAYSARGDVKVTLVTFQTTATAQGYWLDAAAAIAVINGAGFPGAAGNTNYAAGLDLAKLGYGTANLQGLLPNAKDVLYFLSDGVPNPVDTGLDIDTEVTAWQNFLSGNDANGNEAGEKITAYALGMGTGVSATNLNPIAYNGVTGTDTNAVLVTDFNQLSSVLLGTVDQPPVTGNLLTDSTPTASFGADGAGYMQSVTIDGKIYTFDGTNNPQPLPAGVLAADAQYNATEHVWTIKTDANGGKIVIDMDNGNYTYTPPNQLASSQSETVGFTIRDNDGDTASGQLTINIQAPVLVVGQNVDDNATQTTAHKVDPVANNAGVVAGQAAYDVLVGDVGGGNLNGKSTNVVLMLDTSGSMGTTFGGTTTTRLQGMKDGVNDMLDSLAGSGALNVRVHLNDFATDLKGQVTYDLVVNGVVQNGANGTPNNLQLAHTYVNGLSASGNTNYEASLAEAKTWIETAGSTLNVPGVINQAVFVSDGLPNTAVGDGTSGNLSALRAIQNIYGARGGVDTSDEQGALDAWASGSGGLQAIGMGLDAAATAVLSRVEGITASLKTDLINASVAGAANLVVDATDTSATNTNNAAEFKSVLASLNPTSSLAGVGSDVLTGGAGDDIIFGDSMNTDLLGAARSAGLAPGSGWSVFEKLESGTVVGSTAWTRADTLDYVRTHQAELAKESVSTSGAHRAGGNDTITGGDGNDVIYSQEGNDVINAGAGNDILVGGSGNDTMDGGAGNDTFKWNQGDKGTLAAPAVDTIIGFGANGDKDVLDLRDLLQLESHPNADAPGITNGNLASFLHFTSTNGGADTTIEVKSGGAAGVLDQKIILQGVSLASLGNSDAAIITNLLNNGKLITD